MLQRLDLYDYDILHHGFLSTMRDYMLVVAPPSSGSPLTMVFEGCVEARYTSAIPPDAFSMDDRLLELSRFEASEIAGYFVWGVQFAVIESWQCADDTERALYWTDYYGLPMQECHIETNVYLLDLVFHQLKKTGE